MVEAEEVKQRIDRLIVKGQGEILDASRRLSQEITRESTRFVPPLSRDMTHLVDEIFDFTERVLNGQRQMVREVLAHLEEAAPRARDRLTHRGRAAAEKTAAKGKAPKKAPAKKAPAKKTAAVKTAAATTTARKTTAMRTPAPKAAG